MIRLLCSKVRPAYNHICRTFSSAVQSSISKSTAAEELAKDVIIYKNDNERFYKMLNVFGLSQLAFWGFMSYNTLALKDIPVDPEVQNNKDAPFWKKINLGEEKWRNGLALTYAVVGYAILAGSWMYIRRAVRYVILRKDKSTVSLVLYSPIGNRILNVPLKEISAVGSRADKRSYIPIKLQQNKFHFLLDTSGSFPNPTLFDQTVGVRRKFVTKK